MLNGILNKDKRFFSTYPLPYLVEYICYFSLDLKSHQSYNCLPTTSFKLTHWLPGHFLSSQILGIKKDTILDEIYWVCLPFTQVGKKIQN